MMVLGPVGPDNSFLLLVILQHAPEFVFYPRDYCVDMYLNEKYKILILIKHEFSSTNEVKLTNFRKFINKDKFLYNIDKLRNKLETDRKNW